MPVVLVGVLLLSYMPLASIATYTENHHMTINLSFSEPNIQSQNESTIISIPEAPKSYSLPGLPVLPVYQTTISLPFGTKIKSLTYAVEDINLHTLQAPLQTATEPFTLSSLSEKEKSLHHDPPSYFPEKWVQYFTGGGIKSDQRQTFLTLQVFPLRYSAEKQQIKTIQDITIDITYQKNPSFHITEVSGYDLVIISPARFTKALEPLVEHKNLMGIKTTIKPLYQIYSQYCGYDKPEKIKFFIKDAIEEWGIRYVLLIGGMKSLLNGNPRENQNEGTKDWYLPVRYSNLFDNDSVFDPGFISDLYYADIYDADGDFSSWDSNGDGVFGCWLPPSSEEMIYSDPIDVIDFYPDVYIGRLPCRNIFELTIMINKIITYENEPANPDWFDRLLLIAGDPYNDEKTNYIEGELIADSIAKEMSTFRPIRLYASNRYQYPLYTPITDNIIREISAGCGFILFDGHATPASWNTFWPGEFHHLIIDGGLSIYDFHKLNNHHKLPICIIGGCHASQCNVSLIRTMLDRYNRRYMWSYGTPIPECFSWWLTRTIDGGAIATIGSTGLGYEAGGEKGDLNGDCINEPDCVEALGGYLEIQFFHAYHTQEQHYLGQAWSTAITNYLNVFPGMTNRSYAKTVEQWLLIGDPSLRIGGYPAS